MAYIKQYYSSEDEFNRLHHNLKHFLCPFCGQRGFLILHGFLSGYGETGMVKRGHRIFCSNRNNRNGCGRTFSILKSWYIKTLMICARSLSCLLDKIRNGLCPARAFETMKDRMSKATVYRLYHRFRHNQAGIRTFLARVKPPPDTNSNSSVAQTLSHLFSLFPDCMVSGFQYFFQTRFF